MTARGFVSVLLMIGESEKVTWGQGHVVGEAVEVVVLQVWMDFVAH